MKRLLCKLLGHDWVATFYPDDHPQNGTVECARCGHCLGPISHAWSRLLGWTTAELQPKPGAFRPTPFVTWDIASDDRGAMLGYCLLQAWIDTAGDIDWRPVSGDTPRPTDAEIRVAVLGSDA